MSSLTSAGSTFRNEETDSPSQAVVEAVADAEGVDPLDLPPLYASVDSDALDSLFRSRPDGDPAFAEVRFAYHGYEVRVASSGRVTLTEA